MCLDKGVDLALADRTLSSVVADKPQRFERIVAFVLLPPVGSLTNCSSGASRTCAVARRSRSVGATDQIDEQNVSDF